MTGWSLVLYNGNGGAAYGTKTLAGTIPATCDGRVLPSPMAGERRPSVP